MMRGESIPAYRPGSAMSVASKFDYQDARFEQWWASVDRTPHFAGITKVQARDIWMAAAR
jgi:hypothetical protein